jgi:aminotransferase
MMDRSLYIYDGQSEDTTGVAARVANISVSAIKQMPVLASRVEGCISLGQGIPSFDTPAFIREAVREALLDDRAIGRYSLQPGVPELKVAIAERLQRTKSIAHVDPETELVVTCGAMEGLAAAIATLVERGDEVIILSPSYSSHIEQVLFAEGTPVFVGLDEDAGWALDVEAVEAAITDRTKAIIVCSPANPTGTVFGEAELRRLAALAIEKGIFVIADEAYDFLTFGGMAHFSLTSIPELRPRLVATYSFSKMFCMTGWRVGYLYAPARSRRPSAQSP